MIKERQPEIIVHVDNHEYDLTIYDYLFYQDTEVQDWVYITGDALENSNDKVVIYI